jgi:hypothetical protein
MAFSGQRESPMEPTVAVNAVSQSAKTGFGWFNVSTTVSPAAVALQAAGTASSASQDSSASNPAPSTSISNRFIAFVLTVIYGMTFLLPLSLHLHFIN